MKLSIISTMYRSAPFLEEFYCRMGASARQLVGDEYEIVLVNDGSPDPSLDIALGLQANDAHVRIIELSRNFGHHHAIVAGLAHTIGERVFLIDCDLEEQPEWLVLFAEKMQQENIDVMFGMQEERVSTPLSNFFGGVFWKALNFLSNVQMPDNPMTCRLMSRRYVEALLGVGDRVLYLAGVFAWTGFPQLAIPLMKAPRPHASRSNYNLSRKLLQVVDSFASFSVAPLSLIFFSGLFIWAGSLIFGLYLLIYKLISPEMVMTGFTSLMLSLWFLGGSIILILGVLGLYIAKIFQEVKRRPLYIVRNVYPGVRHGS